MRVLETDRLTLRRLDAADAPFVLRLLNEPSFVENIGDRGVRTLDDARRYIAEGPAASYARHGFGLWLAETKEPREPAGLCGLLRRDVLEDVDIGYAFVPEFWGRGYALEAAAAVKAYAGGVLGLRRVVAVVSPHNAASVRLLERLGFGYERMVRFPGDAHDVKLYAAELPGGGEGAAVPAAD